MPEVQELFMAGTEKGMEMTEALTFIEKEELKEFEKRIESGLKTFREVGTALLAIRDGRMYRAEYGTFEDYCRERWGFEKRYAYRLMDAAAISENVSHGTQIEPPSNERQARPLAALPPEKQPEAWQAATSKAESEGRKVTAKDVQEEVKKITTTAEIVDVDVLPPENKEAITDPLSGRIDAPDINADDEKNADPPNLAGLKRYWNYANKKERKAFLQYIKEEGKV
jgi:hypothetical protein